MCIRDRLLLFIAPPSDDGSKVDMNMMAPESVYIAAKEVPRLAPGDSIDIDADDLVFPRPLSLASPGNYRVQAVLDVRLSYNYVGREPGDLVSGVIAVDLPFSASPALTPVSYTHLDVYKRQGLCFAPGSSFAPGSPTLASPFSCLLYTSRCV